MKYIIGLFLAGCGVAALLAVQHNQAQAIDTLATTNAAQLSVIQTLADLAAKQAELQAELIGVQVANLKAQNFLLYAAGAALLGMGAAVIILALTVARVHRPQPQRVIYLPPHENNYQLPPGQSVIVYPYQGQKVRDYVQR